MVKRRLGIRSRFLLACSVLVPVIGVLVWTAKVGLDELHGQVDALHADAVNAQLARDAVGDLESVDRAILQFLASTEQQARGELAAKINAELAPEVDMAFAALGAASGVESDPRTQLASLEQRWMEFRRAWVRDGASQEAADKLQAQFRSIVSGMSAIAARKAGDAAASAAAGDQSYHRTLRRVYEIAALAMGLALVVALWLAWTIVPRARRYARFATQVAAGELRTGVAVDGADELADLGHSLNEMIRARTAQEHYDRTQNEFSETLQMTENEGEAHTLLKVHLERSVAQSTVVVLNRNNSEDRLEAKTDVPDGSPLAEGLDGAKPRDCLAVRFARPYEHRPGDEAPLLSCSVCGKLADEVRCQPLLVGGEVIGSVLANYPKADESTDKRIVESITQAAPVLANLRNLAIAEVRAATDALTGLPNTRAAQDTAKRMVAESLRTGNPLSALLLDLDHFKQINDTSGHSAGDEVLATVGEAIRATVRESDFAGRYGGEEFIVLLPDTDIDAAILVAEKIRKAVAGISITAVERKITTSVGVASLPLHAHDTATLIRAADRALYTAKANGRNRTEAVQATVVAAA